MSVSTRGSKRVRGSSTGMTSDAAQLQIATRKEGSPVRLEERPDPPKKAKSKKSDGGSKSRKAKKNRRP